MGEPMTGKGTQFRRWNSSVGQWEEIAEITSIGGVGGTRDTHDVTTLGSAGGYRRFIPGFRNGGTVTLAMLFTRDSYEIMKSDFESDIVQNYEIILPDEDVTSYEFEGLVTELPLTIPPDAPITVDVSILVSGEIVVNSGSGPSP